MSVWSFFVAAAALAGVIVVWYGVARSKESSELLLSEYEKLLTRARNRALLGEGEVGEAGEDPPTRPPAAPNGK
jgi:hypothetical protein